MGTPPFAVPCLEALAASGYDLVGVFTSPDRPSGRGRHLSESPVKQAAAARGLPVFQPEKLSEASSFQQLASLTPELIVVAAYGQLLKKNVLELPRHGCINVHPSLLPRYRGASPVAGAILNGDRVTGVTIMLMDAGMDTGPILVQAHAPITPEDTTGSLTALLARVGAAVLVQTLPLWLEGRLTPHPQDDSQATYTKPVTKEDGRLDWKLPAPELWLRVRAFNPWPGAYTTWNGKRLKILQAEPLPEPREAGLVAALGPSGPAAGVGTGEGTLGLVRLQLEGKGEMPAVEFVRGYRDFVGSRLE